MNNIEKDITKRNIIKCEKALKENKKKYKFDLDYKKMWEDLVDKSLDLQEEYRELKLQNLELRNIYFNVTHINKIYTKELNIYIAKHQKFIKYLEDEIKQNTPNLRWKHYDEDGFNDYDIENSTYIEIKPTNMILEEILQKYKSIIRGNKDEK